MPSMTSPAENSRASAAPARATVLPPKAARERWVVDAALLNGGQVALSERGFEAHGRITVHPYSVSAAPAYE